MTIALWAVGCVIAYTLMGLWTYRYEYRDSRVRLGLDYETALGNARRCAVLWPIWFPVYAIPYWLTKVEPLIIPSTEPDRQARIKELQANIEKLERGND